MSRGQQVERLLFSGLLLALGAGCNDYPLDHLQQTVVIERSDVYSQGEQTKIDILWVVDDSSSMCEEQATLTSHFDTFIQGLTRLDASFRVAVVSTDMNHRRPDKAARIRYAPATNNSPNCVNFVACTRDLHCGAGGCLCGISWIRRCERDSDCGRGETCVGYPLPDGGTSTFAHCAAQCATDTDCQDVNQRARTLHCVEGLCRVQVCTSDSDCPETQRCLPVEADGGALSVCRRFRSPTQIQCVPGTQDPRCPLNGRCRDDGTCEPVGFCPPRTCDCPLEADPILAFGERGPDASPSPSLDELKHHFRCLALIGTEGDQYEKGLEAAERALTPPLVEDPTVPNSRFLRDDAYLVVIFLSDENDCSDRGAECSTVDDCPRPEDSACREDPVERDRSFCRLPKRETAECEYWSDRLMDVRRIADRLKDVKAREEDADGPPCEHDEACPEGYYCSERFGRCTKDRGRVIVAGIIGDRDTFCAEACPTPGGSDCRPSSHCTEACPEGSFCAERVYHQGMTEPATTCVDPVFGTAYSGWRYHDFIDAFGDTGLSESICGGRIDEALDRIASLVVNVIPDTFCMAKPLPRCASDQDCRGDAKCLEDEDRLQGSWPFCYREVEDPDRGTRISPADIVVEVHPDDGSAVRVVPPEDWVYYPGQYGGCVEFIRGGPGPEEALYLRYITPLDPAVPLRH